MEQKEEYLEKTNHGSPLFPIEYYHCLYPAGLSALPVHWHEEFEITYIRKGSCTYLVDLEAYHAGEGDLLFFASGMLHGIPEGQVRELETDSFVFHPQMLGTGKDVCGVKYVGPARAGEVRFPAVIKKDAVESSGLAEVFEKLKKSFLGKGEGYELESEALLYQFFYLLYKCVPHKRITSENEEVLEKLKNDDPVYKRELSETGDSIGACRDMPISVRILILCVFFKKYMNMTCIEYLNQYRMEIAAGKLAESSQSVTDVALDTGFQKYFLF